MQKTSLFPYIYIYISFLVPLIPLLPERPTVERRETETEHGTNVPIGRVRNDPFLEGHHRLVHHPEDEPVHNVNVAVLGRRLPFLAGDDGPLAVLGDDGKSARVHGLAGGTLGADEGTDEVLHGLDEGVLLGGVVDKDALAGLPPEETGGNHVAQEGGIGATEARAKGLNEVVGDVHANVDADLVKKGHGANGETELLQRAIEPDQGKEMEIS